ncbi:MAG: hypothetical protein OJJ54_24810, partial [Pseudonocardia sp.]|nr:hypothetical protein [Pseudonocardia sp.]
MSGAAVTLPDDPAAGVRPAGGPGGWPLGRTPASYVITDVRVVLPGRVTGASAVVVEDGLIADVVEGGTGLRGDVDGTGLLLLPGLIDVHSDALEREQAPRPSAQLTWDFALTSFEAKTVAAGITTIFHGAGFHTKVSAGHARRPSAALELCAAVDGFTGGRVDHRVLHRFDVRAADGADLLRERLRRLSPGTGRILLSHEDHTPGQGQYQDVAHFVDALVAGGEDRETATRRVRERMAE